MWLRRGEGASLRLGVVASRRSFRRAVDRARAKRLLREAYRLNRDRLCGDCDVILVARRDILQAKRQDVEKDLLEAAGKAGIRRAG
jgi:ribonuclease P protein component